MDGEPGLPENYNSQEALRGLRGRAPQSYAGLVVFRIHHPPPGLNKDAVTLFSFSLSPPPSLIGELESFQGNGAAWRISEGMGAGKKRKPEVTLSPRAYS